MPKKIISKQQIIQAAQSLVANDLNPTLSAIRKQLNYCGSNSTIHKYLNQWKTECFKNMFQTDRKEESDPIQQEIKELERSLKLDLQKQIASNEEYAQELIQAEKTIVTLKEENHKLQTLNQGLKLDLKEAIAIKATLTQINQEMQNRLEFNDNKTMVQKQQLIEELQAELKELNAKSMRAMQELSSAGHEVLMQEKVHSINLQAKNDLLTKELTENHKQLESMKLKAEFQVKVLQRQIKVQKQVLTNYLAPEELKNLSIEELLIGVGGGK